jgi:hypothetical protein
MADTPQGDDTRAIAISTKALVEGLIFVLTARGFIERSQTVELFEEVLTALGEQPASDPAMGDARMFVAGFASRLAQSFPQQS